MRALKELDFVELTEPLTAMFQGMEDAKTEKASQRKRAKLAKAKE